MSKFFKWSISQLFGDAIFDVLKWATGWIFRMSISAGLIAGGTTGVLALLDTNVTFGVAFSVFGVSLALLILLRFVDPSALAHTSGLWIKRKLVVEQSEPGSEGAHGAPSIRASAVAVTPTQLERERDQALLDLARERDALLKQLAECKRSFGIAKLLSFADLHRAKIEKAELQGHDVQDVRATIRFAPPYGEDYTLAKAIEAILRQYPGWQVTIDGKNDPLILPSGTCRVIFEASFKAAYFEEVAAAFQEGELIEGSVGFRTANRDDPEHLIVEVAPRLVKQ